ncbi:MAG: hypothetical protein COV31_01640 [Candidatus Yanofskybacteria bacterium CG10_big_fil_rev_8_21_14_0_10_46_23]|uniref:Thioredoxin domain-containing protein n=1 Tax=Candidatus Yanofskybacteria bacterium CG10_big_fil_rev_8_21_14_0_10_46_23 TaxID=1975098 RepID=A0A2H0R4I5_9BACT|nr:MAG: hypothetical protein COV31_01640 [Candidatus Yanofskybacteria bacterium CG10_big_fil_rev_8_21_14_0_10_46_23]
MDIPPIDSNKAISKIDWPKFYTPMAVLLAGVIIAGAVFFSGRPNLPQEQVGLIGDQIGGPIVVGVDDDPFLGPAEAKVTIIEFSDFQCPFCRIFWREALARIRTEYIEAGASVKFVYRDMPLDIHPMAEITAQASQCANDQGRYWDYHDKIFEEQSLLGPNTISYTEQNLVDWAQDINLNLSDFVECVSSQKYKEEVAKDVADGLRVGAGATPTIFINGRRVVGAQPFETFKAIIDSELNS